jgi:hypothetical protein
MISALQGGTTLAILKSTHLLVLMARTYQQLPPLWYLEEQLELSDQYPSGLAWKQEGPYHKAGEMAGRARKHGRHYYVGLLNERYLAHRIVYFMRTGEDPGNADVVHGSDNSERDNRMDLTLYQRKPSRMPRWRRRVRNADGLLVYRDEAMDGISIQQLEREQGIRIER